MEHLTNTEKKFFQYFRSSWPEFAGMSEAAVAASVADKAANLLPDDNSLASLICQAALDETNWSLIAEAILDDEVKIAHGEWTLYVKKRDILMAESAGEEISVNVRLGKPWLGVNETVAGLTVLGELAIIDCCKKIRFYSYPRFEDTGW